MRAAFYTLKYLYFILVAASAYLISEHDVYVVMWAVVPLTILGIIFGALAEVLLEERGLI